MAVERKEEEIKALVPHCDGFLQAHLQCIEKHGEEACLEETTAYLHCARSLLCPTIYGKVLSYSLEDRVTTNPSFMRDVAQMDDCTSQSFSFYLNEALHVRPAP